LSADASYPRPKDAATSYLAPVRRCARVRAAGAPLQRPAEGGQGPPAKRTGPADRL